MKFGGKVFQTELLSRLSHKECRLLSSPVLLRKFTNKKPRELLTTILFSKTTSFSAYMRVGMSGKMEWETGKGGCES